MINFKKFFTVMLCCGAFAFAVQAQTLESGKVYRFANFGKTGMYMAMSGSSQGAVVSASNSNDLKQQWYVKANDEGTGYYFRNAANGAYLMSPKATSQQWTLSFTTTPDPASMLFSITAIDGNLAIRPVSHNNAYGFAHADASNNVVCWTNSAINSQWNAEMVNLTDAQISDLLARFTSTGDEIAKASQYQSYLEALFTDKACTTLRSGGDLSGNSNYQALPQTLKTMVDKVSSGNWAETDGNWDTKHAKKYRVQKYEPYSEGSAAAGMAGIQAYTNMNNPTGIIANAGEMLYVMVDSQVPQGATLYIGGVPDAGMYNSVTAGTPLKQGLNMILCNSDLTHYFIYYTVNTVENKKPVRPLKNYQPITIHIEGGRVNGFFDIIGDDLYDADTQEDFQYTVQRAKHPMFDMLGKYVILHFFLEDTPDLPEDTQLQKGVKSCFDPAKNPGATKNYNPVLTLEAWDKMCFAERILMGIQSDEDINNPFNEGLYSSIVNVPYEVGGYNADPGFYYSDYFNNRMMGITLQAKGLYMNATAWRTAYAPSTMVAILTQFPQDGIWGPAHEYGHMNQTPMRIAGTTEESNNVFSNVANYYICKTTSRTDYPSSQLKVFNEGKTFLENGTWGTTRMFWQLWCYYHATKHNTRFFPRLYELLRKYPLKRDMTTYPGKLCPKSDMLHFAKMCCVAAGEDLTNFFTAWGFFVPLDNYHIDDYDVYDCILTEADIQEVKDEIKAFNFPKNDAIILIDDRPGSNLPAGFGYSKELSGEYGGWNDFKDDSAKASGSFSFTVDGNNVSVSGGNPGVGFLIYDEEGNLIGFSNSSNFTLSHEAASALVDGKATVKAVSADNNVVEAVDPVRSGSIEEKKALLKALLDRCDALLNQRDESLTHVGQFKPAACVDFKNQRDEVYSVWENSSDSQQLTDQYLALSKAYYALMADPDAHIDIEPGAAYRLVNYNYTTRTLDSGASSLVSTTINTNGPAPFSQQWILQPVEGNDGAFYIKNLGDGRYVGTTKKQSTEIPLSDQPQSYNLIKIENGVYSFAPDNETRFGIHIDAQNRVVQWNTTSKPTQWTFVKTSSAEQIALRQQLNENIAKAEELLSTSGTIERKSPVDYSFPEACMYTNAPYTGNNSDKFTSWNVLFDNNVATYFHSNYDNSKDSEDGLDHYIRMEAPDNGRFRFFNLSYITRQVDNIGTNPKSIVIEASPDKVKWREIYHASGLKTGSAVSNETGEIVAPEDTRYIRFMVVGASSLAKGHPYFCLSELKVEDLGEPIFTPDESFPYLKEEDMMNLYDDIVNAKLDLAYSGTDAETLKSRMAQINSASESMQSVMIPAVDVTAISFAVNPIVTKMKEEPLTVTINVEPEDATFPQFDWIMENENIAAILSTDGKSAVINPVGNGITNLSVNVVGNPLVSASAIVKVLPEVPVEAVVVTPAQLTVPLNAGALSLNAVIYPDNATIQDVTWQSADPSIAEVNETTGEVTLLRQGATEIIATATDGTELLGKCQISITNPVAEGLMIYPTDVVMEPGDEMQFNATYIPEDSEQPLMTWSSSDASVASVDPSGIVKGVSAGETEITVSADINGKVISASANVKVNPLTLKAVAMTPIAVTLDKGQSVTLSVTLMPEGAVNDLVWTVSDADVTLMKVNGDNLSAVVEALKPGMSQIMAYSESNPEIFGACHITVPETAVSEIKLLTDETSFDFADGPRVMKAQYFPADAPTPRLVWESSDEGVARIESSGPLEAVFTPVSNGETTIKVSHGERPEIYDSVLVSVTGASGIASLFADKETRVDVYQLSGQIVKRNADLRKLNDLAPGIYIIKQGKISKEILVK